MNSSDSEYLQLTGVEYKNQYKLELEFNNGVTKIVDFEPFLRNSLNPQINKYLDVKMFKSYTFEFGRLHWNDYDLCFHVEDMFTGLLVKSPLLAVAEDGAEWGEKSERECASRR